MRTRPLLCFCLLAAVAPVAQAQITITETDLRTLFTERLTLATYTATDLNGLQALADAVGSDDQHFDVGIVEYIASPQYTVERVTCSLDLPGCDDPDFIQADYITRAVHPGGAADSVGVSFAQLNEEGLYLLGGASRGDFDDTIPGLEEVYFKFKPSLLTIKLPLTLGTEWTAIAQIEGPDFGGEDVVFMLEETNLAEAWGTLETPQGSARTIKVRTRSVSSITFGGETLSDTSYSITFYTQTQLTASLDLDDQGNVIAASYSTLNDPSVATVPDAEVPGVIALGQNYPNPFNPTTTITFTLREPRPVTLTVFDLLGREVAVLVDGMRPAGAHQVDWQAANAPSGLYLYRLTTGDVSITRPMTLLK